MGAYVAAKGSTACELCKAGGYCEEVGAGSAAVFEACGPGTWSDTVGLNTSAGCNLCAVGTYQPSSGADSMKHALRWLGGCATGAIAQR